MAEQLLKQTEFERPQAIFFDWDGTLVNTLPLLRQIYAHVRTHFGQEPLSDEEFHDNLKYSARELFPRIYGDRADEAFTVWYDYVEKHHLDHIAAMDGAGELLERIAAAGIKMGVVSNKRQKYLVSEIERLGWNKYFVSIVGAGEATKDKPAPDPLFMALDRAGLKPGPGVWYVGDTESDLQCSGDAGCTPVFVRFDGTHDAVIERLNPAFVVDDNRALFAFLNQRL